MSDIRTLYNSAILKKSGYAEVKPTLARIAPGNESEIAYVATLPQGKYDTDPTEKGQYRPGYKIFVLGEHEEGTPTLQLPWATPYGPPGLANGDTPLRLPPNTYVEVIRHGEREGQPFYWIVNVLPNYEINPEDSGYVPGSSLYFVPEDCVNPSGTGIAPGCEANISVPNLADKKLNRDNYSIKLPQPSKCAKVDTSAINGRIEKLMKDVSDLRTELLGSDSFIATSQDFLNSINEEVDKAANFLSKKIAWLIQEIRRTTMRGINVVINNTLGNVYLNLRYEILDKSDLALDAVSCMFLKILQNLRGLISKFLKNFIDKFINTGVCVIESFLSTLLGNLMAQIKSILGSILGPIQQLLGAGANFINSVLSFVESILGFLDCKPPAVCTVTNEWNFLDGAVSPTPTLDFNSIFESAKGIGDALTAVGNIPSDLANQNFDIGDAFGGALAAAEGCLGGPGNILRCGPPEVVFWGGEGGGATGNAVVNTLGEIIGVDIITSGNWVKPPFIDIKDSCGIGRGAIAIPVLGPVPDPPSGPGIGTTGGPGGPGGDGDGDGVLIPLIPPTDIGIGTTGSRTRLGSPPTVPTTGIGTTGGNLGIVNVIIKDPGYNYPPILEGGLGGGGRIFANSCQSAIRRSDTQVWEGPFNEGDIINIKIGDLVYLAGSPEYISEVEESITAPGCPPNNVIIPTSGEGGRPRSGRCQTTVYRANNKWDTPYSKDSTITAYYGDRITFGDGVVGVPGKKSILIDENFTQDMIPGCVIKGTSPKIKDMSNFDYTQGITYDTGIKQQFGAFLDLRLAKEQGFSDQDVRFFLTNKFSERIGKKMQDLLDDPEWGKIPEFSVTFTVPGCPPGTPEQLPTGGGTTRGSYNLISIIGDFEIGNPGFGYTTGDTATIIGGGADIELEITNGGISGVNIINSGMGFDSIPEVQINTDTGYNARLTPVLSFIREDLAGDIPSGTKILSVVDCVGKN